MRFDGGILVCDFRDSAVCFHYMICCDVSICDLGCRDFKSSCWCLNLNA